MHLFHTSKICDPDRTTKTYAMAMLQKIIPQKTASHLGELQSRKQPWPLDLPVWRGSMGLPYVYRNPKPLLQQSPLIWRPMAKKEEAQATLGVPVEVLWRAMSKDFLRVMQDAAPDLVKSTEILEGDGGLGTVFVVHFGPDVEHMSHQKEKIVEVDEAKLRIGLEVIEGGHLDDGGFSFYVTSFQLTRVEEGETLVNIEVMYVPKIESGTLPEKNMKSTIFFLRRVENYLQKVSA